MSDPGADSTDPSAAAPDDSGADDATPTVICTISMTPDGQFLLQQGDEDDDSGEGSEAPSDEAGADSDDAAGAGEGAEGMPPAAGGVAPAPKGQTFDSPGPLLKAVLDLLKTAQEGSGGSADDQMMAGYTGGASGSAS